MDAIRTRIWNERKSDKEPDRLIDLRDTSSIAALFRGMQAGADKDEEPEPR